MGQARRHNRDIFWIFFNMRVCCVFSLEPPDRGDSNEYTIYSFQYKKENHPNYLKLQLPDFSQGTQGHVRNSRGNEPSGLKPLKFYCTCCCICLSSDYKFTQNKLLPPETRVVRRQQSVPYGSLPLVVTK